MLQIRQFPLIVAVAVTLSLMVTHTSALDDLQRQLIDQLIETEFIPGNHVPGLGLAIVHGNDTLAKGYGLSDMDAGIPVGNETLFAIASISKSFTGLVVLRVLTSQFPELGESVLDTPIRTLAPTLGFMLIDKFRSENVNFRDLLAHRVCIQADPIGLSVRPYKNKAELMFRQRYADPKCSIRTDLVYNNALIQLAGEMAAAMANTTFEELLTQLFADIGMTETSFIKDTDDFDTWPNFSKPYYRHNGTLRRYNQELLKTIAYYPGAGGIVSSPRDFLKYLQFQLNNGRLGSVQVIPENVMKWTRRPSALIPHSPPSRKTPSNLLYGNSGCGLGLFLGTYEGFSTFGHSGFWPPYVSLMTIVPDLNIAIFTTINGPGITNTTHEDLHTRILNITTGIGMGKESHVIEDAASSNTTTKRAHSLLAKKYLQSMQGQTSYQDWTPTNENLVGQYGNPLTGEFNVTLINSTTLYLDYGRFGQAYLAQRGNSSLYQVIWDCDIVQFYYTFDPDESLAYTMDFTETFVAYLDLGYSTMSFYKGFSLDILPVQPWEPETCSLA